MRFTRVVAVAVLGIVTTSALVLGIGAPANAVDVNLRDYMLTVPSDVICADSTCTPDQERALTDGNRQGVTTKPVVPLGTPSYRSGSGALPGIFGAASSMLMMVNGTVHEELSYSDELWWKTPNVARPDWISEEDWEACSSSGDPSNIFDGLTDWLHDNVLNGANGGVEETCAEIREDWLREVNPEYEPVGTASPSFGGYPSTTTNTTFGITITLGQPFWSSTPTRSTTDEASRVEGWVVPLTKTGATAESVSMVVDWLTTGGSVVLTSTSVSFAAGTASIKPVRTDLPQCMTVSYCVVLSYVGTTSNTAPAGAMGSLKTWNIYGQGTKTMTPLPYINPTDGSTYNPGLQRMQLLTWVATESGAIYQCRTESFVETAPAIPKPCEPTIPPNEVVTERHVELVPETDPGYVPGSNPTRGISTTTVPDVVRDWQRDFPDCDETLCLLDLELEGVGSCFDDPTKCADWYTDPNKTTKYTCRYGGVAVDLAKCVKYMQIFKPGKVEAGEPYPKPEGSTGGQTGTSPSPRIEPGAGPDDPSKSRQCFPTGWGIFNPFEWVFKPVRCVMEWAFVPRQSYITGRFNTLATAWNGKGPIALATAMSAWQFDATVSGCSGINVPLSQVWPEVNDFQILDACAGEPLAPVAQLSSVVIGIAACIGALFAATRNLAGIVAYGGMGEGKEP